MVGDWTIAPVHIALADSNEQVLWMVEVIETTYSALVALQRPDV